MYVWLGNIQDHASLAIHESCAQLVEAVENLSGAALYLPWYEGTMCKHFEISIEMASCLHHGTVNVCKKH
jgi:hypothetical protein